jgi:hypothetical protein
MSEPLKPCPHCGGPAELWRASLGKGAYVGCMGECRVLVLHEKSTNEEATAAWNRRTQPTDAELHDKYCCGYKSHALPDAEMGGRVREMTSRAQELVREVRNQLAQSITGAMAGQFHFSTREVDRMADKLAEAEREMGGQAEGLTSAGETVAVPHSSPTQPPARPVIGRLLTALVFILGFLAGMVCASWRLGAEWEDPLPAEPLVRIVSDIPFDGGLEWHRMESTVQRGRSVSLLAAVRPRLMSHESARHHLSRSFETARRTPLSVELPLLNWQGGGHEVSDRLGAARAGRAHSSRPGRDA